MLVNQKESNKQAQSQLKESEEMSKNSFYNTLDESALITLV